MYCIRKLFLVISFLCFVLISLGKSMGVYEIYENGAQTLILADNGNQLKSVSGSPWLYNGFNFKDYAGDALEYWYDGNGSLTADHNKGISSITYDSHGCPKSILIGDLDTNATVYVYSSDGRKLRTCHLMTTCGLDSQKREIVRNAIEQEDFDLTDSSIQPYLLSSVTTDYVGNFILEDGILSKYLFGNGYVSFSNGSPSFHYYIRDHLGSVRVVTNDNGDAEQVNNYYPFGGEFTAISTNTELQPWKYTGKEYDHRHGLDLYDFGARMYDPATLLWTSVDSRAEDYYDVSPYVFCKDNPVNAIDLDGRSVDWYKDKDNTYQYSPYVHSQKDLSKGQFYKGSSFTEGKGNNLVQYRADGSILYNNETAAYNRMWNQADVHYRQMGEKGGREVGGFILSDGKVLVLPDYKNDANTSEISGYGYRISQKGTVTKGNERFSVLANIHTHQYKNGDPSPSYVGYKGEYDGSIAEKIGRPVFTMGHDNNVWVIIQDQNKQAVAKLPFKVSYLLRNNNSFVKYVKYNDWNLK